MYRMKSSINLGVLEMFIKYQRGKIEKVLVEKPVVQDKESKNPSETIPYVSYPGMHKEKPTDKAK